MLEFTGVNKTHADLVLAEILQDGNSWFKPIGYPGDLDRSRGDFDDGRMRFLNRNLNYFYLNNMIVLALKNEYEYNPNYPKALEFCNSLRTEFGLQGPFGRMCIWKLGPNCSILPHYDRWDYHHNIIRFIFFVSQHSNNDAEVIISGTNVTVEQGRYFNFSPANERHSFTNKSDTDFYFLGFDFWKPELLNKVATIRQLTKDSILPYENKYGSIGSITKYTSKE